jgi:hypothetical protein
MKYRRAKAAARKNPSLVRSVELVNCNNEGGSAWADEDAGEHSGDGGGIAAGCDEDGAVA